MINTIAQVVLLKLQKIRNATVKRFFCYFFPHFWLGGYCFLDLVGGLNMLLHDFCSVGSGTEDHIANLSHLLFPTVRNSCKPDVAKTRVP